MNNALNFAAEMIVYAFAIIGLLGTIIGIISVNIIAAEPDRNRLPTRPTAADD